MKSILMFVCLCGVSMAAIDEFISICDLKKPNLNECVVKSANSFIFYFSKGIKALDFPPLDPLKIYEMNIDQNNAPISLKIKLINTTHTGLSSLRFDKASVDVKNNRWILNATLPQYSLTGRYKGSGRLLLVPIIGEGDANFTYSNMKVDFTFDGNSTRRNDVAIYNLSKLKVFFTFDKCFISMTNLFGGNRQLSETVNQFIGNNSKEVMNGLKNSLEKIYSSLYFSLIRKLISNVPYSNLFKNF